MSEISTASLYASPKEARKAPAEEFLYLACLHEGTGVEAPDFIAVVDAESGRIVHETPMPNVGDELHHFGWNRCSSACHGPDRSHLIVPGFRSSRIHVLNVADDPRAPRIEKVIERDELVRATGLTRPHTVHCMPGENIVISMLGDADGNGACGFAVLDARTFELKGRWDTATNGARLNYDFWYQPRQNALASSEFGEPNAYEPGFDLDDVAAGRYGSRLHFWNLAERRGGAGTRARRDRAPAVRGALAARPRRRPVARHRRDVEGDTPPSRRGPVRLREEVVRERQHAGRRIDRVARPGRHCGDSPHSGAGERGREQSVAKAHASQDDRRTGNLITSPRSRPCR